MIGEVLGGYKVLSKLGEGATGETYLAAHQETGQNAAAKVLFPAMSADRAILDRFFAEVRASSHVNHVGIADLFDCGVHGGGRAFLVMDLLEGKTLTDALIELGSVSDIESFADIGWQLATMLAATHASKIVHGALKPDAIFLTFPPAQAPRPLVKLVDFGMAKFSLSVRHSQTGSLLGAPLYMSPEIGRGLGNIDHRADVYSLGCILFEMACGRPPFVREGKGELIIAHATETAPSVSSLEPAIPQAIDTLIGRMLTKNPATRPQGMGEVAAVLEKFFKCPVPGASQDAPATQPKPLAALATPAPPVELLPAPAASIPPVAALSPEPAPKTMIAPRRQDPTALLPPSAQAAVFPESDLAGKPPAPQAWVARVHQRTAILEPPSASKPHAGPSSRRPVVAPAAPTTGSQRRRLSNVPRSELARPKPASSISLPIVIASAFIVLAVGAGILLLRGRKPAPADTTRTPIALPRKAPVLDEASPLPSLAQPSTTYPSPAATRPATPPGLSDDRRARPASPKAASAGKPKPGKNGPAPRW
jgi:serine/threonine protein kinase